MSLGMANVSLGRILESAAGPSYGRNADEGDGGFWPTEIGDPDWHDGHGQSMEAYR